MPERFRSRKAVLLGIATVALAGALTAPLYGSEGGTSSSRITSRSISTTRQVPTPAS